MKAAIVCVSVHHGNTRRVAQAMADALGAGVLAAEEARTLDGRAYDLIGFGSGIYFGRHHVSLRNLVREMPSLPSRAFVFSTAGIASLAPIWHKSLVRRLRRRGCEIVGQFCCPGWDTVGPLKLFGGIHTKRPNEDDLHSAANFARSLMGIGVLAPGTGEATLHPCDPIAEHSVASVKRSI
jgi:flavodoxin